MGDAILQNEGVDDFADLVAKYRGLVWGIAYRTVRDRDEALDVAQEVLLRLHRSLPRLAPDTRLGAWLTRVTTNTALNAVRDRATRARRQQEAARQRPDRAEPREAAGLGEAVARGLAGLPRQQRAVVTLRLLEQRTFREIAEAFGVSDGTVKVQFARGMRRLRSQLEEWR